MILVKRIDTNGYFLEDVLINDESELTSDLIQITIPQGLYLPMWNGIDWVEGKLPEEVYALEAQKKFIEMSDVIQSLLDSTAQQYRYDNIMSARSYCGFDSPFRLECENLASWAAQCWVQAGIIENDVKNGLRPIPTEVELLQELPVFQPL